MSKKTPAIICDLDGTISLFKDKGHRGPYDATHCDEDDVNLPVLTVLKRLIDSHAIVFLSGREDKYRQPTVKFLTNKCGFAPNDFFLFMRQTNDQRKDSIVKEEMYRELVEPLFDVFFVMDDRSSVVSMWREIGLTCFQVAEGNF